MRKASLLFVGAVSCQELFVPARPLQSRRITSRIAQATALCKGTDNANKNYCNGEAANTACDATGVIVSVSEVNIQYDEL